MRFFITLLALVGALAAVAPAHAQSDVARWPQVDGIFLISRSDCGTCSIKSRQIGSDRNDKLLGGHESNVISGRGGNDVLWGDHFPSGQPTGQRDVIHGGAGRDFIYDSHGSNTIRAGSGPDILRVKYSRGGLVDCGPGRDTLYTNRKVRKRISIRGCERVTYARIRTAR
jgi:hypothetical protein